MTDVRYRRATLDDAPAIAALHADSWRRTYRGVFRDAFLDGPIDDERRATWRARLASADHVPHVAVAVVGSIVRGFVCAYAEADAGWGVFVDNLHVAAADQGAGLGTGLLHTVATWALQVRAARAPYLWVLEPNVPAQRFYQRRGATRHDAVVMENPGGGTATYLRYAWRDPTQLQNACSRLTPID